MQTLPNLSNVAIPSLNKAYYSYVFLNKAHIPDSEIMRVDLAFGDDFFKQNRLWDDFGTTISGM